ncbi:hypothetical protein VitviT2T_021359 [Vitis vinifera]|uniref:Reverse transcriptase domain-containing protein n=1 Tax=Vitis vinifera TaxID=29760 RepID=A0ABY9D796_VITVI|nr:hypothetical protein VitviT2T_021359 [Vitis vinifera]
MLVDSTTGHSMLSFMDGFFGYSQIMMALKDMEKTSLITEWGTYCYKVMPFGLKNAGTTYQRATTILFHDMMHWDVEVYVDDIIVKSQDRVDHLTALKRFFDMIRQFRLGLNPKKCTFGVTSRIHDEDIAAVTTSSGWRMYFDVAANHFGYGIGVLLISHHDDHIPRFVRLAFSGRHLAMNNIVEYECRPLILSL